MLCGLYIAVKYSVVLIKTAPGGYYGWHSNQVNIDAGFYRYA